jgi:hypothetical protein
MLKEHVVSVYFKCFRCFRGVLQLFHTDVAKVDQDVAYVAMTYTRMLQGCVLNVSSIFQKHIASVFILDVAYVSRICCKCFI